MMNPDINCNQGPMSTVQQCARLDHAGTASGGREELEVMQVIVVHLDLFMCGTCGKQSTDILDHVLHKSQHPTSTMYTCELCKLVYPCRKSLLQHYSGPHSLAKLQTLKTEECDKQPSPQVMILPESNCYLENAETKHILSWKMPSQVLSKENGGESGCTVASPLVLKDLGQVGQEEGDGVDLVVHDHGSICQKEKKDSQPGKDIIPSKSSSRARSKQLLKTAKRTLTHVRGPLVCSDFIAGQPDGASTSCARTTSRKPRILQRRVALTTEINRKQLGQNLTSNVEQPLVKPKVKRKSSTSSGTEIPKITIIEKDGDLHEDSQPQPKQPMMQPQVPLPAPSVPVALEIKEKVQCLHCDFASHNRDELSHHMNTKHKQTLELPDSLRSLHSEEDSPLKKEQSGRGETDFGGTSERKSRKPRQPRKVERQDLPGVYPCSQCGKSFQRLRYLRKHAHVHRTEKKFICDECGKLFKCKGYLRVHQRKTHEGEEKVFKCNQCEFESSINAAIHAHRQIHSQGSVLCDTCGYAYTDKATLAKHKRVHDPRRPFACNFPGCTWRFKTEIMCKAHIRAHTTEGKFRCAYCGYVFRHKHHLQRHEANVHGIKHQKSKTANAKEPCAELYTTYTQEQMEDGVNIIVSTEIDEQQLKLDDGQIPQQFLIIEPEGETAMIGYGACELESLSSSYVSMTQKADEGTITNMENGST